MLRDTGCDRYSPVAAAAVRVLRERYGTAELFAKELGSSLGAAHLSRQAVYDWERGKTRVPATVLVAGALIIGISLDELWHLAERRARPFVPAEKHLELT